MNNGTYGSVRLSDVKIDDIDVFYTYIQGREVVTTDLKATRLNASEVLTAVKHPDSDDILGGLYNLKLPSEQFANLGIYNILITPKVIKTKVIDNGVLSAKPDVRGIVLDVNDATLSKYVSMLVNGGLEGYRIEYIDTVSGLKIPNTFRIITSSNRCEPITENLTNTNQKSIRYRFNDVSNLLFLTLTPSAVSDIKPTVSPFIGEVGQEILIYNTFFNPIMLEVEIVDTTLETLKHGIYGNQVESQNGELTIYTADEIQEPYKKYNLLTEKDEFGKVTQKIKMEIDNTDSESFGEFFSNLEL
jgi:hypothetical protein